MATYLELFAVPGSATDLRKRITVAVAVKAHAILTAQSPTAGQIAWAKQAIQRPTDYVDAVLYAALAANKDLTVAQIQSANDAGVQAVTSDVVDKLLAV